MSPILYAHPFSSYCQKALIAFYENETPFEFRMLSPEHPDILQEFEALWPVKKFPVLVDGDRTLLEATVIVEYVALAYPGPFRPVPQDPAAAIEVRMLDRLFDNYISTPQQKVVLDAIRPEASRDPYGVAEARTMLERAYQWLDRHMQGREWAAGAAFSLADCAAAPSLFYADWTHPIDPALTHLSAYRARLLARPSFARAVDEARPYRKYFPLGAPDRD